MNVSGTLGAGEVVIDSGRIQAPYRIDCHRVLHDKVIVLIDSQSHDKHDDSDFDLPDPGRNIVAIDSGADVVWTVSDVPPATDGTDTNRYVYLFTILGDLYAQDVEKRLYEIDPTDGAVRQSFDSEILPIGEKRVSVDGWINKVIESGDKIFLRTGEAQEHSLYGFDTAGTELWKSEGRRGQIYVDGDQLLEKRERGPRTVEFYRLDKDTGDRIAEIEVENTPDGWRYVRDVTDDE